MIHQAYSFVNKGSWRALSFILAIGLTLCFFFNVNEFATALRSASPYWVILILWATVILWIHGIGFEIKATIWQCLFFLILVMPSPLSRLGKIFCVKINSPTQKCGQFLQGFFAMRKPSYKTELPLVDWTIPPQRGLGDYFA